MRHTFACVDFGISFRVKAGFRRFVKRQVEDRPEVKFVHTHLPDPEYSTDWGKLQQTEMWSSPAAVSPPQALAEPDTG